jgi:hypothetical protein
MVLKGRSLFAGREGEVIAAPIIEIVDDPTDSRAFGAAVYDSEGLPTRRNELIVDGELRGFLHNVYTGRRSGLRSTGSAVRGGYTSGPGVGVRALTLRPGTRTPEALMKAVGDALRAVGQRAPLRHQPDQRRLLGGRRRAHGARWRVRRARARSDDQPTLQRMLLDDGGSRRSHVPPGAAAGVTILVSDMTLSGV